MAFLTEAANRGSVSTGYNIEYSNKFESDNSEAITRNYDASTGANCIANNSTTNAKKFTVSYWIKKTELLASGQNIPWIAIAGGYATVVKFQDEKFAAYDDTAGWSLATNAVFRDTSAWYHLVCAVDTTQSTASDRVNLYVNGVLQTSFSTENYGTQNADNQLWKVNTSHTIGNQAYFKGGYIAELHCIDGTQYAASDFGEYDDDSGIWIPKEADVTYGDQGYYLNWSDFGSANSNANNTGIGKDHSGNTNPFVNLDNWSSADIATDTPTNNFCTLNPLYKCADTTMTDGATNCDRTNNGNNTVRGTFVVTTGKWYWEVAVHRGTVNTNYPFMGMTGNFTTEACSWLYGDSKSFYVSGSGNVEDAGSYKGAGTAAAQDPSHSIYGFAVDIDNEELYWYTNGTANNSGNAYSISTSVGNSDEGMTPFLFMFTGANQSFNFGGYSVVAPSSAESDANGYGTFEYAPPSGYYALCTKNLAEYG